MDLLHSSQFLWAVFGMVVFVMLAIDLGVFHRRAHRVAVKEAAIWCAVWISLALLFNAGVLWLLGRDKGLEFLAGYLIEESLSLDNIFIWVVIFSDFALPERYQHRVLFYGILGAMVFRGVFITVGVTLLHYFHWIVYIFGGFLLITAGRLVLHRERQAHLERNPLVWIARRFLPITQAYDGQRFLTNQGGRRMATPLILVLLVVETTDVVFALDSVPAVLSITQDPFIVYTSNVFAILGLRAMFFLLTDVLHRMKYLKIGLAFLLGFVGVKMLISNFYEFSIIGSLLIIAGILGGTILASYLKAWQEGRAGEASTH